MAPSLLIKDALQRATPSAPSGNIKELSVGLQGKEGMSSMDICRKNIPGQGNSQCKGPEVEAYLACLKNNSEEEEVRKTMRLEFSECFKMSII
jgi:hypothetical protein